MSTTGFGVPFGAYNACQIVTSKFGSPASCAVGTFGKLGIRVFEVTAYTSTLPAWICAVVLAV